MDSLVTERTAQATAIPAKRSFKAPALIAVALAGVAGVAWYGHNWWTVGRFFESTDDAYVGADVVTMAPNISGFVTAVAVTDNQPVRAGDLLIKIDDRGYRTALAKAEASVATEQAALANLEATRKLQMALIPQAQAGVASTDAVIAHTQFDRDRYERLSSTAAASVETFQKADADYRQAVAAGQSAAAALDAARQQVAVIDTQRQQAEAALAGAMADRDNAQLDVDYTEIRSPVDGTVGNRSVRVGGYATVGSQIMAIVPADGLWVAANFKESQLAGMHEGLPVTIEADVLPGQEFKGHVTSLAPATGALFSVLPAENATGNFTKIVQRVPVKVALDGDASRLGRLRPGLSVTASVDERPSPSEETSQAGTP